MVIQFKANDARGTQQYCIHCQLPGVIVTNAEGGQELFRCTNCGKESQRAIIIDPSVKWWIDDKKIYWHQSVGAILINNEGKILLFRRTKFPIATVFPAGHINANEQPEEAFIREVKEETGISLKKDQAILLNHEVIHDDSCRRGSDDHEWWIYAAYVKNSHVLIDKREGKHPQWKSLGEINTTDMPHAAKYILEKNSLAIKEFIDRQEN